ncbi:AMP-binding protein, partial [Streptomyces flavofungini]|uniref:AMP-binding protein n=1 Tax=Streptomyces flavofungini TaxID=68200 RepID=UPI0034DEA285
MLSARASTADVSRHAPDRSASLASYACSSRGRTPSPRPNCPPPWPSWPSGRPTGDFGTLATGAVVVPVYPTAGDEELAWVLTDSGARVVICENTTQAARIARPRV